jgi:hypothetical protein
MVEHVAEPGRELYLAAGIIRAALRPWIKFAATTSASLVWGRNIARQSVGRSIRSLVTSIRPSAQTVRSAPIVEMASWAIDACLQGDASKKGARTLSPWPGRSTAITRKPPLVCHRPAAATYLPKVVRVRKSATRTDRPLQNRCKQSSAHRLFEHISGEEDCVSEAGTEGS